jgi:hypothetical protein
VIARNTAFTYKSKPVDAKAIGGPRLHTPVPETLPDGDRGR